MIESAARRETGAGAARPRIALAHDWLCGYRGGEAVLERIALVGGEVGEIAGLYTMFDDRRPLSPAVDGLRGRGLVRASRLSALPGSRRLRRWMLPLYPRAVAQLSRMLRESHRRGRIDLLFSTSSAAIKGMEAPPGVPHICYCHSPARYVWSQRGEYGGAGGAGGGAVKAAARGVGLRLYGGAFRQWDRRTARNVDTFLANSTHTARLIRDAFGRSAEVVHPPVRTDYFTPGDDAGERRGSPWLLVSALEPYKRVDIAVRAAKLAGERLVIAGKGSERRALEGLARSLGAPVEFRGRVSDEELRELYRGARLLLFPQVEDFGIVAAEALACGTPVVARRAGGAADIVEDGVTGALFEEPTAEALLAAAARCPHDSAACRRGAERFGEARFDAAVRAVIARHAGGRS